MAGDKFRDFAEIFRDFVILHKYLHEYLIFIEYKLQFYFAISAQKLIRYMCFITYSLSNKHACACSVTITSQSLVLRCGLSAAVCIVVYFPVRNVNNVKSNATC